MSVESFGEVSPQGNIFGSVKTVLVDYFAVINNNKNLYKMV